MKKKLTIGRRDKADFPEFGLSELDVKVDTGAFTSSIHCHHIREIRKDGKKHLEFDLLDPAHAQYHERVCTTERYTQRTIKNSFGESEKRYVIKTVITLFGRDFPVELSLSERGAMKYPVLLGRKLLSGRFVVDPGLYNLSHKEKMGITRNMRTSQRVKNEKRRS